MSRRGRPRTFTDEALIEMWGKLQGELGRAPSFKEAANALSLSPSAVAARSALLRRRGEWPGYLQVLVQGQRSDSSVGARWPEYWATHDRLLEELGRKPLYKEIAAVHGVTPQAVHSSMRRRKTENE